MWKKILISFSIPVAFATSILTVYDTKIHTVVNYKTQIATNTITIWTTDGLVQQDTNNHAIDTQRVNPIIVMNSEMVTTSIVTNKGKDKTSTTLQNTSTNKPTSITSCTSKQEPTLTSTIQTTVTLDDFATNIMNTHNQKRALHKDTPNLYYSTEIAAISQKYADDYLCDGILTHHGNILYGENLALGYDTIAAVTAWYDEISNYNFSNPSFNESTGHFTQLVWSNTTLIGCGYKNCGSYFGQYTVCQYSTPGNYAGLYGTYVKPLKS